MPSDLISVVIPALNEGRHLGRCLAALSGEAAGGGSFEVVLVDNGSRDATLEVARPYGDRLPLRLLARCGVRISAVRNYGALHARGERIAFLDADCVVRPGWITQVGKRLAPGVLTGSPYLIPEGSRWVARAWYGPDETLSARAVSFVPGGTLLVMRDDFERLGGFDETIETNEDYEFCQRARDAGLAVVAYPDLAVVHLGTPQTLSEFFRRERWYGKHVLRVFLRGLPALKNLKAVSYAVFTLVCWAAVLGGAGVFLVLGNWEAPAAAVGIWLGAASLLAACRSAARRDWRNVHALVVLFLAYGTARALCLLNSKVSAPKAQSALS